MLSTGHAMLSTASTVAGHDHKRPRSSTVAWMFLLTMWRRRGSFDSHLFLEFFGNLEICEKM